MTWGIYCKVCNRLLWRRAKPFAKGELMLPQDAAHSVTGVRAKTGDVVQWCGCKGGLGQQELAKTGAVNDPQ